MNGKLIFREELQGSRQWGNILWALIVSGGGLGFFCVGLASFFNLGITDINFFPQGLVMSFYGIVALLLAGYLWLIIILEVGNGYNEFNKETGVLKIFRLGFPGKTRSIKLEYSLSEIEGIEVKEKPEPVLLVCIKGGVRVPLTTKREPITLGQVEEKATQLASFLKVPLLANQ